MVGNGPSWSLLVLLAALAVLAVAASALDRALADQAAGRTVSRAVVLDPLVAGLRLLFVARRSTRTSDGLLWRLGAGTVLTVPVLAAVVVPLGGRAVADLSIGVVWYTALVALLWVGVFLVGWGGNSAYALVAGYRFVAQALAYEMPLALSVITAATAAHSLRVGALVQAQQHLWFVVWMPAAFVVYLIGALALSFWGPFATPVAPDLAGGVLVDVSGVDRLLVRAGQYVALVSAAAFAVPVFLGGGLGPVLPPWLWSLLKTVAVLAVLVTARSRLPLVRMDRFEELAWVVLIPLVLVQLLVVCIVILATPLA